MKKLRTALIWIGLLTLALGMVMFWGSSAVNQAQEVTTSAFVDMVEKGQIAKVHIDGEQIVGEKVKNGGLVRTTASKTTPIVVDALRAREDVVFDEEPSDSGGGQWFGIIVNVLFLGIFIVVGYLVYRNFRNAGKGGGGGLFGPGGFGKHKAKQITPQQVKDRFGDVIGAEAVEEVSDVVDFLRNPEGWRKSGARVPRGILLLGPTGTGKTLLARALAGEAAVPFFSVSASEFVEMFVGVGASRVRDLFEAARKAAPSIIFIDEVDGVAGKRSGNVAGKHEEREQTLNELLIQMDGLEDSNAPVIVIAATNRADLLDPAMMRVGRFDRKVFMDKPDLKGREQIVDVLLRKRNIVLTGSLNSSMVAKRTPGMTGADLEGMLNEAAIKSHKLGKSAVDEEDIEYAVDKVTMGIERRSKIMEPEEIAMTAVHETAHAICAHLTPGAFPVYKFTCIPRSNALGVTAFFQDHELHTQDEETLKAIIRVSLAGRAGEELVLGQVSSGCSDDLKKATSIAHFMTMRCGMGGVPLRSYGQMDSGYLGNEALSRDYSEEAAQAVDAAVNGILAAEYETAKRMLMAHAKELMALQAELQECETLGSDALERHLGPKVRSVSAFESFKHFTEKNGR